jgi:Spy/CpxP family protein refolding chaperone
MTSLIGVEAKTGPRGRLLWLALILSLTLNIFFLGGLFWSRLAAEQGSTPEERFTRAANSLNLSPDQHEAFQQFATDVREHSRHFHEANGPLIQQVWAELAKPQPDQALIASLVDQTAENRHSYQRDMTGTLSRFLATLTPEQRAQFIEKAQKRQDQTGGRIRRMVTH